MATADLWARQREILGAGGQDTLLQARALVVGCGGLGAGAIPALVAAGVGSITLMDDDVVEESNLNRQTLFTRDDLGQSKVERAAARMQALSPNRITGLKRRLTADDVELVAQHDVVLDCTDKNASRLAIDSVCATAQVPWVWAAIDGWSAVLSVFTPETLRWRDVVGSTDEPPRPPQVLGATPALAGAWQAAEALKVLTGVGSSLANRLAIVDLLRADVRFIELAR